MPHTARKIGASGFYHAVVKGINGMIVFEDDADRNKYLSLLDDSKRDHGMKLHAYCLMSNHVHLVVEDPGGGLAPFMKQAHELYAMHFAEKTGRTGGIFTKPYWSEPIEDDAYLLCAVRYVHANPAAQGLCAASAYEWSSARDYLGRTGITDTSMVLDMCGGRAGFIEFSKGGNSTATPFPGSKLSRHLTDEEALGIARAILGTEDIDLASKDRACRRRSVSLLHGRGFTVTQIARITGLGRNAIKRLMA